MLPQSAAKIAHKICKQDSHMGKKLRLTVLYEFGER